MALWIAIGAAGGCRADATAAHNPAPCDCPRAPSLRPADRAPDALTIRIAREPATLLSLFSQDDTVRRIADHSILQPLVTVGPSGDVRGVLASAVHTGDRRVYDVDIAHGVRWHDGVPFSTQDVVFTLQLVRDPAAGTRLSAFFRDVSDVAVTAPSRVRITLDAPSEDFVDRLAQLMILPAHVFGDTPPLSHPASRAPVGTGPMEFAAWVPDKRIVLRRGPQADDSVPATLTYRILSEDRIAWTLWKAGELDVVTQMDPAPAAQTGRMVAVATDAVYAWLFNAHRPLFDPTTRRALLHALDRTAVSCGAAACTLSDALPPFVDAPPACPTAFDPDRAHTLLRKAGWRDVPDAATRVRNRTSLRFAVLVPDSHPLLARAAVVWAQDLRAIGVDMRVTTLAETAFWSRLERRAFDAAVVPAQAGSARVWRAVSRKFDRIAGAATDPAAPCAWVPLWRRWEPVVLGSRLQGVPRFPSWLAAAAPVEAQP